MLARFRDPASSLWLGFVSATAVAHVGALLFCRMQVRASNVVQLVAAILVVAICFVRAKQTRDAYLRSAWIQLGVAFGIYSAAQAYFTYAIFWQTEALAFPSFSDHLWMIFALPILLVLGKRRSGSRWEWVDWLDAAQACVFFSLLFFLVFSHVAALSVSLAYDLQSAALILSWAVRYASTEPGPDQTFMRRLGLFLMAYGLLSAIGNAWYDFHLPAQAWVGICWSGPLLFFGALVLRSELHPNLPAISTSKVETRLPSHFHGIGALGLTVMSIAAAGILAMHRLGAGAAALTFAFVIFAVRTSLRESQLHVAHSTLEYSVMHDPLTGLSNRSRLISELDVRLSDAVQASQVGLLFIDLDRFKLINDSLGHEFGDRFLVEVASVLRSAIEPGSEIVRLGGDEFVVMLHPISMSKIQQAANTLVQRFRQPIAIEGRILHVSVSVGYAMGRAGMRAEDLLRDADLAMYTAKKQGKNQAHSFSERVEDTAEKYLALEIDLRKALGANELVVYYQPIYSLGRNALEGFEALSRWRHPVRGLVSPADFIPIAEETGLIIEIGKQVLRAATTQVKLWNEQFGLRLTASVNVSARQFADPHLLDDIKAILAETGLPPTLLKLEITETVLLTGTEQVKQTLAAARALGIEISLDDFLTGYSSLSYLLQYPCDVVKIDRSFVHTMDKDPRRAELVRTAVQLARNLDMKVIAEGVELEEELFALADVGCDLIQGFLFSKPIPIDAVENLLRAPSHLALEKARRNYSNHRTVTPGATKHTPNQTLTALSSNDSPNPKEAPYLQDFYDIQAQASPESLTTIAN